VSREWFILAAPVMGLVVGVGLAVCWPFYITPPCRPTPDVPGWSFVSSGTDIRRLSERSRFEPLPASIQGRRIFPGGVEEEPQGVGAREGDNVTGAGKAVLDLSLVLSVGGYHKLCRINGRLYGEGDEGPGFTVAKIEDEGALIILDNGERVHLRVNGNDENSPLFRR